MNKVATIISASAMVIAIIKGDLGLAIMNGVFMVLNAMLSDW